jgi:ABC-type phosphate transport system substrate-binding protein
MTMLISKSKRLRVRRRSLTAMVAVSLSACGLGGLGAESAMALGEHCSGSNVAGRGAYLQNGAQTIWSGAGENGFNGSSSPLACSGSQGSGEKPKVTYVPIGSPLGMYEWGAYDGVFHSKTGKFLSTEEPPAGSPEEEGTTIARMTTAIESDLAVVPVTQTAIAIVANGPDLPAHSPCTVEQIAPADLEEVFSGQLTNWRELSTASDQEAGGDCDQAITRVVREEASGTTYQFKHYLDQLDGEPLECTGEEGETWAQLQPSGAEGGANVVWPRKAECKEGEGPVTVVAAKTGEGSTSPLNFVAGNPGTITYAGLPEAMSYEGIELLAVGNGAGYATPATEAGDANCGASSYALPEGVESGVNVDWSQVYGSDPTIGEEKEDAYPICSLSWIVAATDSVGVFGKGVATTVHDYVNFAWSTQLGISGTHGLGYAALPGDVQELASVAAEQINGEEGEEEGEEEGGGGSETGTVLCRNAPEEKGGTLNCPAGKEFSGEILGALAPETEATFKSTAGPTGTIACGEAVFKGQFAEDGTSESGGVAQLQYRTEGGDCGSTFEGSPKVSVELANPDFDLSRFVYLSTLAPHGSFVLAKSGGLPLLLAHSTEEEGGLLCLFEPTFLAGQVVNGPPTVLSIDAGWKIQEGNEACPVTLHQEGELHLTQGESEGGVYVAGE